ncbi:MAG: hypothetical protein WAN46_18135 [Gammaproteobacteria bacterium]|jgi:hypothetical protein
MSLRGILWQAVIKHAIILVILFLTNSAIQSGIASMLRSNTPDPFRLGLIVIVSSVIIAGLLAGYLSFRYGPLNDEMHRGWRLILGHLTTGGLLFVIGALVLVLAASLGNIHASQGGWGGAPVLLIGVLYLALIAHDVYGLLVFTATP